MSRIFCVLASFCLCVSIFAQVTGRVTGRVADPSGALVANAKVSLFLQGGSQAVLSTQTTSDGLFDFTLVRPDNYDIVIESPGFAKYTQQNVNVDPSRQTSLPQITLRLESASQAVEVHSASEGVETDSSEVASTVTQAQVKNLPVPDRQITSLFRTQAGVSFTAGGNTTIDGLRPSYTNVLVDGVNIQDAVRTNSVDNLPARITIGQVAEFTIASSGEASSTGGAASTISVVTPSGTNQLHGSAFWYNRNNYFAANNWFSNRSGLKRPFLNLNQFGGSIGGPVKKDKFFYYGNYETYSLKRTSLQTATIPTPTARQGILQYKTAAGIQQFDVLKAAGLQASPFIQNLLKDIPTTGNRSDIGDGLNTTGYSFNQRNNEKRESVTGKVDYNLSTKHVLSGSYIYSRDIIDQPGVGGLTYTAAPLITNPIHTNIVSGAWRSSPTPTLTNEFRAGLSLLPRPFARSGSTPAYFLNSGTTLFTPGVATFLSEGRDVNSYTLQDNANWIRGKHAVSFGFQATLSYARFFGLNSAYEAIPTYNIGLSASSPYGFKSGDIPGGSATDIGTANNLLASIAGLVSSAQQTFNVASPTAGFVSGAPYNQKLRYNRYAPYVADTWKVLRNLSLTLGVRWEYFSPVSVADRLLIQPDLINNNINQTLLGNATLNFAHDPMYKRDLNNFAPNVGFAWDVFGNGRAAIRGSYGIEYVDDNTLNTVWNIGVQSNGLNSNIFIPNLNGRIDSPPPIATPKLAVPTTALDQFRLSGGRPQESAIDPNLATPYVQQWNFGIQQEWKGTVFEARYVGNHAVKEFYQRNLNQVNINQNGFLADFNRARSNGFLAVAAGKGFDPNYNAAIAGSQPLSFLASLPNGGNLRQSSIAGAIQSGQIATLAQLYQNLQSFPGPGFSYFPNPLVGDAVELTNFGSSTYNSGQFEVRRRTRGGSQFQANYTFSKALSNTSLYRSFEPLLDNNNHGLSKTRAGYDVTHSIKVNHYVPLPFGPGQRFDPKNAVLSRVAGGWGLSGFYLIQSGEPVSIVSNRNTFNIAGNAGNSITNPVQTSLTLGQLKNITGVHINGSGAYFIDPKYIGSNGAGVSPDGTAPFGNQVFFNPDPGTVGSLQPRSLSGPWFNNYNFAILKDTKITERQSIQIRADFYNLFNHPNFLFAGSANVNSLTFGRITSQFLSGDGIGPRLIQFGLYYRF